MKKRLMIVLLCLLLAVSACGKTEIRPTADEPASEAEAQTLSFETSDLNGNAWMPTTSCHPTIPIS